MIKRLLQHAIELLHPTDANDAEQTAMGAPPATKSIGGDYRNLTISAVGDLVHIVGDLPALEGAALMAAITAIRKSLIADGIPLVISSAITSLHRGVFTLSDVLIRDIPEGVLRNVDERARQLGLSRQELLRRRLVTDFAAPSRATTREDLQRSAEVFGDVLDDDVMSDAWR